MEVDERQWIAASLGRRVLSRIAGHAAADSGWEPSWRKIVNFKPDLVCVSHGSAICGLKWMSLCRVAGIPYVSLAQANSEHWWPEDRVVQGISEAYEGARRAYFVSRSNLALFERQIGLSLSNGEVVWNPFNVGWEARPAWPDGDKTIQLACVARLEPAAKGQDLLFQVLALPKWRGRPLSLTLFGKGPCEKGLRRLAEREGILDRVRFGGHVADIEDAWRTHHALALPSRYEGLPLSLVEAMLCGRPAIVTDVAGNTEPLEDNVTGFVAAAPTVRHLDEALERAWQRRHDWQEMGEAAAASIRRQIPQNPPRVFAEKLAALA